MRQRYAAILVMALGTAAVLWFELRKSPETTHGHYAARIPLKIGDWVGEDLPVSADSVRILGTKDIINRYYTNSDGRRVSFQAVFAQNNRRAVHPPEICARGHGESLEGQAVVVHKVAWPASGYQPGDAVLTGLGELTKPTDFKFKELVLRYRERRSIVNYWYKAGSRLTCNAVQHEWNLFRNNFTGGTTTNSLLRVSAEAPTSADVEIARRLVYEFTEAVFPYVIASMP
ncbi:MAG TPA: EpsI family protein [Planctomycetota bacterium]|nr:EpsI family protein [Planctomycetota bacterium]